MDEKPEALRLAAELEACPTINYKDHAAELRRLHELNTDKTEIISALCGNITELLEALRSAAIAIEVLGGRSERYRAAIAKAEGK